MKTFIIIILSCVSVFGVDSSINLVTTSRTNTQTGDVIIKDEFTRSGRINLVRQTTTTKEGKFFTRMQDFYDDGALVAGYLATSRGSLLTIAEGSPCSVNVGVDTSQRMNALLIFKAGTQVDSFRCTNGVFFPVEIRKNNRTSDKKKE
jgi:hypothetical protein